MDYHDLTHKVTAIAREAGDFIQREKEKFKSEDVKFKGQNDLVSYVDVETEKLLVKKLDQLLPEAHILAEEGKKDFHPAGYTWVIDPLDGTTNFVHQLPVYCTSIALMKGNKVVSGVVYEMNRDECFTAVRGQGAYLNGNRLQISTTRHIGDAMIATGFPYHEKSLIKRFGEVFREFIGRSQGVRRFGSAAIDLCYTACGRFDGYYEAFLKPWDVAAGTLMVSEAGGKVMDFNGGNDYIFGKQIIAGNPQLTVEIQDLLNKTLERYDAGTDKNSGRSR